MYKTWVSAILVGNAEVDLDNYNECGKVQWRSKCSLYLVGHNESFQSVLAWRNWWDCGPSWEGFLFSHYTWKQSPQAGSKAAGPDVPCESGQCWLPSFLTDLLFPLAPGYGIPYGYSKSCPCLWYVHCLTTFLLASAQQSKAQFVSRASLKWFGGSWDPLILVTQLKFLWKCHNLVSLLLELLFSALPDWRTACSNCLFCPYWN